MTKKYLSIDLGSKTMGLATSNGLIAKPWLTLQWSQGHYQSARKQLFDLIIKHQFTDLIVGLPLNANGTDSKRSKITKQFANILQREFQNSGFKINVYLEDERYSTIEAQKMLINAGYSAKKRQSKKDSAAAAIILSNFLEKVKNID